VALAFLIVTAIHITFGELVPKLGAIPNSESVAIRLSRPLGAFPAPEQAVTGGVDAVATRAVRLLGVGSGSLDGESHTPEDIKVIISQSQSGGDLDAGEAGMLGGVFHLTNRRRAR